MTNTTAPNEPRQTPDFQVIHRSTEGPARTASLGLPHGNVRLPAFMPVGTRAAVRGLLPSQVRETGADILLANTYHLHLRPGEKTVCKQGGLHGFMQWDRPILTDSGGFQVFSLGDLCTITEEGVEFKSHLDGSRCFLGPTEAMEIQIALGADIIMSFDECVPYPADRSYVEQSVDRTSRWEEKTLQLHPRDGRALFAIVQGGIHADLRRRSAQTLLSMNFDGYAIGGLFVGEARDDALEMLSVTQDLIPDSYPRYVMGVGTPLAIIDSVMRGWDMFDCVLPTRNGRHGTAMTWRGKLRVKNAAFANDSKPIEEGCHCLACRSFSRAYLRHLIMSDEILGATLVSQHNLTFMQDLMQRIRDAIVAGNLRSLRDELAEHWDQ